MDLQITRLLTVMVSVLLVVVIGLGYLVQTNSRNIDRLEASVRDTKTQVSHLDAFVTDLENETPEELEQSLAIAQAVRQVPEIREILCEAFPQVSACKARPG